MFEYETRDMFDDAQETLSWYMSRKKFDNALQIFIERKKEIPLYRRRFYFSCIQDGLSDYKSYRRVIKTAIIMLIISFLIQPLFSLQLLDAFVFLLPKRFLYYNYFAALFPHILNVFFVLSLMAQWHIWVILPGRLFEQKAQIFYRIIFYFLIMLLSIYTVMQIIPFAMDFPMVHNSEYLTCTISEDEMIIMVYGEIIATSESEDVVSHLLQKLSEEYGIASIDDIPVHYYKYEKRILGNVHLFYLDAEKEYYELSPLQLEATSYDSNTFPIVIKYLRICKIILQIENK